MKRILTLLLALVLLLGAAPAYGAESSELKPGLYVAQDESAKLYLYPEGVGVLAYYADNRRITCFCGALWKEDTLEVEHTALAIEQEGSELSFSFSSQAFRLQYKGEDGAYALGKGGTADYSGFYEGRQGQRLVLSPDGKAMYTDKTGSTPVYWGRERAIWTGILERKCFLLWGSFLGGLTFTGDGSEAQLQTEGGQVTLNRVGKYPAGQTVATGEVSFRFPAEGWEGSLSKDTVAFSKGKCLVQVQVSQTSQNTPLDELLTYGLTAIVTALGGTRETGDIKLTDCSLGAATGRRGSLAFTALGTAYEQLGVGFRQNGKDVVILTLAPRAEAEDVALLLDGLLLSLQWDGASALNWAQGSWRMESVAMGERSKDAASNDLKAALCFEADGSYAAYMHLDGTPLSVRQGTYMILNQIVRLQSDQGFSEIRYSPDTRELSLPAGELTMVYVWDPKASEVFVHDADLVGRWQSTKGRSAGQETSISGDKAIVLTLKADGGAVYHSKSSHMEDLTWRLDRGQVRLSHNGTELNGLGWTYENGCLILQSTSSLELVFEKQG